MKNSGYSWPECWRKSGNPTQLGDQFLVLDEPTSAFDLSHQKLTLEIVRGLAEQGTGVVMVLHDLNLAARCADNLVVFDSGTISAQGSPEEVLTEALISQVFGVKSIIAKHPVTQKATGNNLMPRFLLLTLLLSSVFSSNPAFGC